MNRFFNLDSPLFNLLTKFADMMILSALWMLFSLPLLTIGTSSAALYHSVHKVLFLNEGNPLPTFWASFKTNLKQGILLELLCLPIAAFCIISYFFSDTMGWDTFLGCFYLIVTVVAVVLLVMMILYVFPILSRFYMKIPDMLKTAFALAISRFGFTLILILVFAVCTLGFLLVPITGFLLPSLYSMAAERLIEPAFQKALDAKEKADAEREAQVREEADSTQEAGPGSL